MKTTRRFLLVSAAAVLLGVGARAQTPQRVGGSISAGRGHERRRAKNQVCRHGHGRRRPSPGRRDGGVLVLRGEIRSRRIIWNSKNKSPQTPPALMNSKWRSASGFLLARKPGLAPAWKQLNQPLGFAPDTEEKLALTPPAALAGLVVDEADKPVANAEVSVDAVPSVKVRRKTERSISNHLTWQARARLFFRPHGCRRPFPHPKFSDQCHGQPCRSGAGQSSARTISEFRRLGLPALARGPGRHQIGRGTGRQHRR